MWKRADHFLQKDDETPTEDPKIYPNIRGMWPEWHQSASCLNYDSSLFFGSTDNEIRPPYTVGDIQRARGVCSTCPVFRQCLQHALKQREEYGVWASTTRKDRKKMLAEIDSNLTTIHQVVEEWTTTRWVR